MEVTHQLRADHDAILVGIGTLLADNPRLTVRHAKGPHPRPIILDSWLRFPPDSSILINHPLQPIIATTFGADSGRRSRLEAAGAEVLPLPPDSQGRVDIQALLDQLPGRGLQTLMVEGGAGVITSFLAGRWVDRLIVTISPALIGGLRSVEELLHPNSNGSTPASPYSIDQFPQLSNVRIDRAGRDLILSGRVHWGEV